jgi:hypothetical protein
MLNMKQFKKKIITTNGIGIQLENHESNSETER